MNNAVPKTRSVYFNNSTNLVKATQTLTSDATNVSNNETVVIGATTYTFKTTLTAAVAASSTLTSDTTEVAAGTTVVIGSTTYVFAEALPSYNEYETVNYILIDAADPDQTLQNLVDAINGSATGWGTTRTKNVVANTQVGASAVDTHATTITALTAGTAGNSIALTSSDEHLVAGAATLESGVDTVAYQVKIGASAAVTLDNLKAAINASGTPGTEYSVGTLAHPSVTATTNADTTQVVQAKTGGVAGNTIASTETSAHLSWGAATLTGGGGTVGRMTVGAGLGGKINYIITICPQLTGTPTYTVKIEDSLGNTLYTSGALNENATTNTALSFTLADDDVIVLTANATVEDNLAVKVALR